MTTALWVIAALLFLNLFKRSQAPDNSEMLASLRRIEIELERSRNELEQITAAAGNTDSEVMRIRLLMEPNNVSEY